MNPYDAARYLTKAVRESHEYASLKKAQEELKDEPSAREMLLDFRRQQLQLQRQVMAGLEVAEGQTDKQERLYQIISMNNLIRSYLEAEYRMSVLMQDVQKAVAEAFDLLFDPELLASPEELLDENEDGDWDEDAGDESENDAG